jgi:hypothetical protein
VELLAQLLHRACLFGYGLVVPARAPAAGLSGRATELALADERGSASSSMDERAAGDAWRGS